MTTVLTERGYTARGSIEFIVRVPAEVPEDEAKVQEWIYDHVSITVTGKADEFDSEIETAERATEYDEFEEPDDDEEDETP